MYCDLMSTLSHTFSSVNMVVLAFAVSRCKEHLSSAARCIQLLVVMHFNDLDIKCIFKDRRDLGDDSLHNIDAQRIVGRKYYRNFT